MRAFLGLGSNLGDRRRFLRDAVSTLGPEVVAVSQVYETEPIGGPQGQGPYLNLVVQLDTQRSARELLGVCHRLETAAGRVRQERWAARTLDVDILWIDGVQLSTPDLEVPHPRTFERRFVAVPLAELAPDVLPEGWRERAAGQITPAGPL